jgi:hypothetical protein
MRLIPGGTLVRNWIPVLGVVVLFGAACSGPSGPSGPTGSLTVNLKDGPYADAEAMLVTFSAVSAHHADAEWQPLTFAGGAATVRGNYSPDTTHRYVSSCIARCSTTRQPPWPTRRARRQ